MEGEIWGEASALYHKIIPALDVAGGRSGLASDGSGGERSGDSGGDGDSSVEGGGSSSSMSRISVGADGAQVATGGAGGESGGESGGDGGGGASHLLEELKRARQGLSELRVQVKRRFQQQQQLEQQRPGRSTGMSRLHERQEREVMEQVPTRGLQPAD